MLEPSDEPESFPVRSCGPPFILTWLYGSENWGGGGGGVPITRMAVFGVYVWVHLHLFVEATTFPVYLGDQLGRLRPKPYTLTILACKCQGLGLQVWFRV